MDKTGHTTLAEWTPADERAYDAAVVAFAEPRNQVVQLSDRKSTRLNSSH